MTPDQESLSSTPGLHPQRRTASLRLPDLDLHSQAGEWSRLLEAALLEVTAEQAVSTPAQGCKGPRVGEPDLGSGVP